MLTRSLLAIDRARPGRHRAGPGHHARRRRHHRQAPTTCAASTFAADGKIYVSGHQGDVETETDDRRRPLQRRRHARHRVRRGRLRRGRSRARPRRAVAGGRRARRRRRRRRGQRRRRGRRQSGLPAALRRRPARRRPAPTGAARPARSRWSSAGPMPTTTASPASRRPPQDTAWDLLVDTTGGEEKLVVAGLGSAADGTGRTDNDRYVARLLAADGSPDPAFNGGAPFTYHSAQTFDDGGRRASVEADGSIMSAGYTNLGETLRNHVILIRLNPDGTLDQDFGGFVEPASSGEAVGLTATPGVAVFNPFVADGGFAECYAAAQLSDGSYVTTGYGAATARGRRLDARLQDDRGAGRRDLPRHRHGARHHLGAGRPAGDPERGRRPADGRGPRPHGPGAPRRPDAAGRPLRRHPGGLRRSTPPASSTRASATTGSSSCRTTASTRSSSAPSSRPTASTSR